MAAAWRLKLGGWLTTSAIVAVVVAAVRRSLTQPIEWLRRTHPVADEPMSVLDCPPQPDRRSALG